MKKEEPQVYRFDADGAVFGRLATKVAFLLCGKNRVSYLPNVDAGEKVVVKNISKAKLSGRKMEQKKYYRHSGYPGGLRERKLKDLFLTKPEEVFRKTVSGMLPKNKLRTPRIKRLSFE